MKIDNIYNIFGSVKKEKIDEIVKKIKELGIDLSDVEEQFIKGGGKGGQKINKTANAVVLKYLPLNIVVRSQRERSLGVNRFLALRELVERIENEIKKDESKKELIKKRRGAMILEGKTLASMINEETKKMAEEFLNKKGRKPFLAIINYFENSPSTYYMNLKVKKCASLGIDTRVYIPQDKTDKKYFLSLIEKLNSDPDVDAIMVEKPLPDGFDDHKFWDLLNPSKDVDSLSSINMGRLLIAKKLDEIEKNNFFVPQTAYAVIKLIKYYNIDVSGKDVVVIGRSAIVGKPLAIVFLMLDANITICHSKTKNLQDHLKKADIIITAIGRAKYIKKEMIGENQIIIDVGTNFDENGNMCGDVDFDDVKEKVKAITPVPGGVGPVTLSLLLNATVRAAKNSII